VQRERHTGFPLIPGSSIKGVLADSVLQRGADGKVLTDDKRRGLRTDNGILLFGRQDHEVVKDDPSKSHQSGGLSIGEARLLAFPVRSAKGCFAWVTSPLVLKRWEQATNKKVGYPATPPAGSDIYGNADTLAENGIAVLEDYAFEHKGDFNPGEDLLSAISDSVWKDLSATHLCFISDDMMAHFARTACEVAQHVSINDETGAADDGKLFNQENVPADTLFYSVFSELKAGTLEKLSIPSVLQIGGDGTTGLGYCTTETISVA
jgi:CRISPR-associated protein Cmr4